jgi:hypothetical protein
VSGDREGRKEKERDGGRIVDEGRWDREIKEGKQSVEGERKERDRRQRRKEEI